MISLSTALSKGSVMRSRLPLCLLLASVFLAAGCGRHSAGTDDLAARKVRVVTTTGMITDLVKNVGGERVEVTGLMGAGVDPHLYRASEGDTVRMARADILFYNGLHLEGKMADVFAQMHHRVRTVAVAECLDPARDVRPAPEGYEGTHDPHVWFDVRLWRKMAAYVRDALAELDPAHAAVYEANAARYQAELDELDRYVRRQAEQVPSDRRVLITAHDAFYYFGHAYGFEVQGLMGVSTDSETSPADIQKLAEFVAARKVPAIFVESSVAPKTIQAVQAAVRAKGFDVKIGGELYSDALGSPGTPEGTYIGMVRHNIDTIAAALR